MRIMQAYTTPNADYNRFIMFSHRLSRKGMLIATILMLLAVLMTFIFTYSRSLSTHNLQLKRIQLGAMTGNLAIGCANVVAQVMEKETGSIYNELSAGNFSNFSYLLERRIRAGERADISIPNANHAKYEKLVKEMVESVDLGGVKFTFEGLKIYFQDVSRIVISEDPFFMYRDMLEKQGYLTVEAKVSSSGGLKITKSARVKRPFKVVNLLPPILSRFSLFIASTPDAEAYNLVELKADRSASPVPLTVKSSPTGVAYSSPVKFPPDAMELQLNGWIYIGPTDETPNDNVYFNIADGYSGPNAQMTLFGRDPGNAIIRFSAQNPLGLRHWLSSDPSPVMFFHHFEGIQSEKQSQYNSDNLFNRQITPKTSWLQLYGNEQSISRTLVLGPVFGRFLKFMEMGPFGWEPDGPDGVKTITDVPEATKRAWRDRFLLPAKPPDPDGNMPSQFYELFRRAEKAGADTSKIPVKWKDVFTDISRYPDYASREIYVPFNQFFDLVKHPTLSVFSLPSWFFLPIDPNDAQYIAPGSIRELIKTVSPTTGSSVNCAYMARDMVTFGYSQGLDKDFFVFAGDLNRFKTSDMIPLLFEGRATKKFTLQSGSAEMQSFKDQLITMNKVLDMTGIILIHRDPEEANPAPLILPSDMTVMNNAVLVFDRGDVAIDGIQTRSRDIHLTIVALNGSIRLTSKPVQAFLIALKPPNALFPDAGKLISSDGKSIRVDGGVAVHRLGIPSSGDWSSYFKEGGWIQYNHTLNPCNYWFEDYYTLALSDASPYIEVKEN